MANAFSTINSHWGVQNWYFTITDISGNLVSVIDRFIELKVNSKLNSPGMITIEVANDSLALADLNLDYQVNIYPVGSANSVASGVYRGYTREYKNDTITHVLYFPELLSILSRAIVAYTGGTANKSSFSGFFSNTLSNIFNNNLHYGTDTGREVSIEIDYFNFASFSGSNPGNVDYNCEWKNVLVALKEVLDVYGWDMYITGTIPSMTLNFVENRGADKTDDIILNNRFSNTSLDFYDRRQLREITVGIAGDASTGSDKRIRTATGANHSTENSFEQYYSVPRAADDDLLDDTLLYKLKEAELPSRDNVHLFETQSQAFGAYGIGDRISIMDDQTFALTTKRITAITMISKNNNTSVELELNNV